MATYTSKLVKGTAIIAIMALLIGVLGYLIRITIARNLSVEDYGLFYAVVSFVGFFIAFKNLSMGNAIARYIPKFLAKKDLKTTKYAILATLFLQIIFTGIITILLIIFSSFIADYFFHTQKAALILVFMALSLFFSLFHDVFAAIFTGFQKPSLMSLPELFKNSLILILLLILFNFNKDAVIPSLVYFISAFISSFIFSFLFLKLFPTFFKIKSYFKFLDVLKSFFNFKKSKDVVQKLRNFGFFIFFNAQGQFFIGYTDILAITFFRTLQEVGLYSAAVPLVALIMFIPFSLTSLLMPVVSEIWAKNKKNLISNEVQRIQKYALIVIIPIALSLFAFSDVAIRLFFGEKYVDASIILKILSIGAIINTLAVINKEILNGIGKPSVNSKIIFVAVVINLIACLLFVPVYGMIAAAISTIFSYFLILLLNSKKISKEVGKNISIIDSVKLLFSGAIFLIVLISFKLVNTNIWIKIIVAVFVASVVYFVVLFLFKLISKEEFAVIKKRFFS